jgi:integrase
MSMTETHIKPALGAVKLSKLTPPMIQKFYNELQRTGRTITEKDAKTGKIITRQEPLSAKTVKNIHGIMSKALSTAVDVGYIKSNPTERVTLPRVEKKEIHPLTSQQIADLLKLLPGHPHEYLYQIALFTGMREGELLGLPWDCVDYASGTILVKQQLHKENTKGGVTKIVPPKNDKSRIIPMAPSVAELFRKQRARQDELRNLLGDKWTETGLVFTGPFGGYLSYRTVYDCFKRLAAKIGAPEARVHDLRHTYAMVSLENGDDIKTVQGNLGHATAAFTLDVYGHVSDRMKKESSSRMEEFIRGLTAPEDKPTGPIIRIVNG